MRSGTVRRGFAGVMLWLFASMLWAATPLMTRFPPDLDVYPQYFSVARSSDGLLYVGTIDAVLRFDGVRWESFALPRPGAVRVLQRDRRGRLWFGANDSFGWIERTADGGERLVDVTAAFEADVGAIGFADVWDSLERDDGMYFRALRWLFHVDADGRRLHAWHAPDRFGGIAEHNGELIVNWRGEGLKKRVGDRFELIPGGASFAQQPAFTLLSLDAHRLLVHDETPRLVVLEDGVARPVPGIGDGDTGHFQDGRVLDARHVVFASDDGVLRIVDVASGALRRIRLGSTFQNGMDVDSDGALLVVDDVGVVRLPWPVAWNVYGEDDGISGSVHDAQLLAGELRLQTASGEIAAPWDEHGARARFAGQRDHGGEAWSLLVDGDTRLLADTYGLQRIDGTPARVGPDDLYPRLLLRSRFDPARAWVGAEAGFAVLQRDADGWQLAARHTDMRARVMSLVETASGEAWLGSEDHGLVRVRLAADPAQAPQIDRFEGELGLAPHDQVVVSELAGVLYASAKSGLFRWDGTRFSADAIDGLAALLPTQELVRLRDGVDGVAWAYSFRSVYKRDAALRWQRIDAVDRSAGAIEVVSALPDGDLVIGSSSRLLHYDAAAALARYAEPQLRLHSVRLQPREGVSRALALDQLAQIDYAAGGLTFRVGLVDLARTSPPQFQARVAGLDEQWSDWSPRAEFSYAQIPPGDYHFEARARSSGGHEFPSQVFDFRIVPRWYQRTGLQALAALLAFLLAGFALSLTLRARIRRLDARNRTLHALVRAHTAELELANTQLRDLAERDGLTGVANRRRFDTFLAASLEAAAQTRRPVAVLLADVDHFKAYNDAHGHLAGDGVLRCVAAALVHGVRENTLVARFGGEEFCLVVPQCELSAAGELGRRLCAVVAESCGVTISIGAAATVPEATDAVDLLLARADAALYRAKGGGRNRVEVDAP